MLKASVAFVPSFYANPVAAIHLKADTLKALFVKVLVIYLSSGKCFFWETQLAHAISASIAFHRGKRIRRTWCLVFRLSGILSVDLQELSPSFLSLPQKSREL